VKLFCDEMLGRLGRWLRVAGYDAAIAKGGATDAEIIARYASPATAISRRGRGREAGCR
jgi:uncharacterized protein with PIN domain